MNAAVGLMDGLGLDGDRCIRVIPRHLDVEGPELDILRTIPLDKITIDVLSVEYKVTCDDKKEWVARSFEKLQRLRKFFKRLGNYKEEAILPWGSGINPDKEEGKG